MRDITNFLAEFDTDFYNLKQLTESGSGRKNYRFESGDKSYILTVGNNMAENDSFLYLTDLFKHLNGNVPDIIRVSDDHKMYIQEDLGTSTLLDVRLESPELSMDLYEKTVKKLAHLQIGAHQIVAYDKVYDSPALDSILVLRDLFYFKHYFLDFLHIPYAQKNLLREFETLANAIEKSHFRFFMFRDFQGRNVMLYDGQPYFIDYQDGMEGPIAYDLASILWQAKAALSQDEKAHLLAIYAKEVKSLIPNRFDEHKLMEDFAYCTLARLLQVLGAYGKLGIIQQKSHFKESMSFGIKNLKEFSSHKIMDKFPVLKSLCDQINVSSVPKI